jgi:hypothetical protein
MTRDDAKTISGLAENVVQKRIALQNATTDARNAQQALDNYLTNAVQAAEAGSNSGSYGSNATASTQPMPQATPITSPADPGKPIPAWLKSGSQAS